MLLVTEITNTKNKIKEDDFPKSWSILTSDERIYISTWKFLSEALIIRDAWNRRCWYMICVGLEQKINKKIAPKNDLVIITWSRGTKQPAAWFTLHNHCFRFSFSHHFITNLANSETAPTHGSSNPRKSSNRLR